MSVVSTKIPFKGTGKEYIGDDISEIATAVKVGIFLFSCISKKKKEKKRSGKLTAAFLQSAIQQCCIQLKSKIMRKMQAREQQERKRNLNR